MKLKGDKENWLRVLTYHRVAEPSDTPWLNPKIISARPRDFLEQIKILASSYKIVSAEQVLEAALDGKRLPRRSVLITFDDAYIDFKGIAWPILKKYGLPVTLFVPTSYPDQPQRSFWWDRLYAAFMQTSVQKIQVSGFGDLVLGDVEHRLSNLHRLQQYIKTLNHGQSLETVDRICADLKYRHPSQVSVLSWSELRELAKQGVSLGAHTRTHPILTQVSSDQLSEEITGSCRDLKRETGAALPIFAYPNGNHNNQAIDILKETGIKVSFTTMDGFNDLNTANPYRLNRTNITRNTSPFLFRLRLQKWFSHIDKWRHKK